MVLLFLRDWRSVIVVVLNIPFALLRRRRRPVADRADDQPDDARRPGPGGRHPGRRGDGRGREHPHQMEQTRSIARAVRRGNRRRRCRGCWRCSASWPCSSRRSSCRGRPGRCSCRCRWPSASRWSPRTCSPARSCRSCPSGCCAIITDRTRPEDHVRAGSGIATAGLSGRIVRWRWAGRAGLPRRRGRRGRPGRA